jgi:hydroxymethylpyrimidine/phosphomethylpyrimidine kinase
VRFAVKMATAPRALTIAGSDSGGGAGIQADLKTFAALGVYGASAITALTAQDTAKIYSSMPVPPEFVAAQIDAVLGDIGADAVKTGMLGDATMVETVAERLRRWEVLNIVVDPVTAATDGTSLLANGGLKAVVEHLFPMALVVTPNIPEAETLLGRKIETWQDMREAAKDIRDMGPRYVVIKGGHRRGEQATDILFDGEDYRDLSAPWVETTLTHGTGCTFAAAVAAGLAKGDTPATAVLGAKAFITRALQNAYPISGSGKGPVHHFYRFWKPRVVSP